MRRASGRAGYVVVVGIIAVAVAVAAAQQAGRPPSDSELVVWAVHDGEKVKRDDLRNGNKARNAIWDGQRVTLVAVRNEVVAFQVIVEAGVAGITRLNATLPRLSREGGQAIVYAPPATDPTLYRDRPIQVFSQHYMSVTEASRATWIFRNDTPSAPKDSLGWMPVQLVPENATAGRGGFPLRVEPRQNQGLWLDIYVGRDLAPGQYRGEVTITADTPTSKAVERRLPIELDVVDVTLPAENSLRAMVYYQKDQPELYQGRNLDPAYHRFAKRHRVEFVDAYDPARALAAIGRFRGTDFTRAHGYEGPGEGVGNRIVPRTFYGPGQAFTNRTPAEIHRAADEWMQFVEANLPQATTFLYMPDEPRPDKFPDIRALAETLRTNPGPGRRLPTFVTHGYTPELASAIDVWCAVPWHYDIARAASERAAGKQSWFYNGGRPAGGSLIIDYSLHDRRHDHSDGMQRGLPRDIAHAVIHFECTVE